MCRRRRHQILLSTHSSEIFEALPQRARTLVIRVGSDVEVVQNALCLRTTWELSGTIRVNKPLILVEDIIAKYFLQEILRRYCVDLFEETAVVPVGSTRDLRELVRSFREHEICCIGVRDADTGESSEEGLLSLPGDGPPELVLLAPNNLERAEQYISGIQGAFERAKASGIGYQRESVRYKQIFESLTAQLQVEARQLVAWLMLAWLSESDNDTETRGLVRRVRSLLEAR